MKWKAYNRRKSPLRRRSQLRSNRLKTVHSFPVHRSSRLVEKNNFSSCVLIILVQCVKFWNFIPNIIRKKTKINYRFSRYLWNIAFSVNSLEHRTGQFFLFKKISSLFFTSQVILSLYIFHSLSLTLYNIYLLAISGLYKLTMPQDMTRVRQSPIAHQKL